MTNGARDSIVLKSAVALDQAQCKMNARKTSQGQKTEDVASVKALASQAVTALAARRAERQSDMSRNSLQDLIDAVLAPDLGAVNRVIARMQRSGISNEEIMGTLIPDAARRLGEGWLDDTLGFAEVTIGSARLQRGLHGLTAKPDVDPGAPMVLVIVPEDEHHTLGALVMAEQLRRAGVSVTLCIGEQSQVAVEKVATGRYRAILISVAALEKLSAVRQLVDDLRRASTKKVPIVVGGAIGHIGSEVTGSTGADYAENDPYRALRLCGLTVSATGDIETVA